MQVKRYGSDVHIIINDTGEVIDIKSFFGSPAGGYDRKDLGDLDVSALDIIEFSDGTVWNKTYIRELAEKGSIKNDVLHARSEGSVLYGLEGDDSINGGDGDDELYGGEGTNSLKGGGGNDILRGGGQGGLWADNLNGGQGNDTYLLSLIHI